MGLPTDTINNQVLISKEQELQLFKDGMYVVKGLDLHVWYLFELWMHKLKFTTLVLLIREDFVLERDVNMQ